jgi:hypothetical protein
MSLRNLLAHRLDALGPKASLLACLVAGNTAQAVLLVANSLGTSLISRCATDDFYFSLVGDLVDLKWSSSSLIVTSATSHGQLPEAPSTTICSLCADTPPLAGSSCAVETLVKFLRRLSRRDRLQDLFQGYLQPQKYIAPYFTSPSLGFFFASSSSIPICSTIYLKRSLLVAILAGCLG